MRNRAITIVPTGTANLASVLAALKRAGSEGNIASDASAIRRAAAILLPGVGGFGAAMSQLEQAGFADVLRERIADGIPLVAICLGMQLLFESSEESPGIPGLGILKGRFERFPRTVRVPHVGWNDIEPLGATRFLTPGCAYFTHSYRLATLPVRLCGGQTTVGSPFVSAVESGGILACQFHPELSGEWGIALIRRWLKEASC